MNSCPARAPRALPRRRGRCEPRYPEVTTGSARARGGPLMRYRYRYSFRRLVQLLQSGEREGAQTTQLTSKLSVDACKARLFQESTDDGRAVARGAQKASSGGTMRGSMPCQ
eukprot:365721-Chlamydomonas_euryale.AAC.12